MTSELKQLLSSYLQQSGLSITEQQQQQLLGLVAMLNKWNKAYNLTSVRDPKQMLIRHIMDSLVVSPYLKGELFIDVGTGPGFPGLPLAIINPDKEFVLLDSLGKRIRFQKQVQFELGIHNIISVENRVEDYTVEHGFDGVLSRAFASVKDMLDWCKHLPNTDGVFYALKGQLLEEEMQQIPQEFTVIDTIELKVPNLIEQRHLLKLVKNK
ncbi:16S rRNA (guanine(527)-N(7))-methyltransferase RsmG [Parashewanella spongiae]|uniref:Ribosomal RNA small subunit methyltransferase G n=1 Tax=Parashewanella spongiae TaxID=342950 RepID=A0A3A6TNJ5_9GAMM|nr:16S rRNA (guanine(527)-N(7))-methyltransferase RsmG [Parashewanella spongiae]MCL1078036.1 16S rRNA (guanine(527)-N(7))-methyltransferase RsmG [Parashewanella spongiae]RJY17445.1 16S rRNA (guanine(527)-N(7))-methyltransferase RsmG [Parashewanella spongiae]